MLQIPQYSPIIRSFLLPEKMTHSEAIHSTKLNWSRPMRPDTNNYKNNLLVLINGATESDAFVFAALIRENRRHAIFIGGRRRRRGYGIKPD